VRMKDQGVPNRGVAQETYGRGCVCETPHTPILRGRFSAAREQKDEVAVVSLNFDGLDARRSHPMSPVIDEKHGGLSLAWWVGRPCTCSPSASLPSADRELPMPEIWFNERRLPRRR
jgi:hypothetical protein